MVAASIVAKIMFHPFPSVIVSSIDNAPEYIATRISIFSFICMHSRAINIAERAKSIPQRVGSDIRFPRIPPARVLITQAAWATACRPRKKAADDLCF